LKVLPVMLLVLSCILVSGCVQEDRVYRIGILSGTDAFVEIKDGFISGMAELGYLEGENVIYDVHELHEDRQGEQEVSRKFVEDGVDLIFAFSTEPALAAKAATQGTGIPVVFAMGATENTGLVESVRQPGGHITGVRFNGADVIVKMIDFALDVMPDAKNIWVLHDTSYPAGIGAMATISQFASENNMTIEQTHVSSLEDIASVLESREGSAGDVDFILMVPDVITLSPEGFAPISEFASEHSIPIIGGAVFAPSMGSLLTYIPDNIEMGELAAPLADKILDGTQAGTIPVVTPEAYLTINYGVAEELGLNVSENLLAIADEIIR
jgi:putative ABC transport system substrate-binding protein